jgi:peptidyl-prolyl cis-trans isomerase-like protein 2
MFNEIKEKGYAQIVTNLGSLNIELFCDKAPRTCYNFIMLSKQGYYNGIIFHRKIKNFMIQGGDPTSTGKGGESYWKKDFADEFKRNLSHNERGLMSMANKGKNTNSSQLQ